MATSVLITGSGTPVQVPGRAGPGVLVRHGATALQFDVGRATSLRLADAGIHLLDLSAVFITHHHSDHMVGLADLLMSHWLEDVTDSHPEGLQVFAPLGAAADIASGVLDVWQPELAMRAAHTNRKLTPTTNVHAFEGLSRPAVVERWGDVEVSAALVDHSPVVPAVGYRIDTPDGSVAISGDTTATASMEDLAAGADVLVHEAFRSSAVPPGLLSDPSAIAAYHTDAIALGTLAKNAGVDTLVLTHLIPAPSNAADRAGYESDMRDGGFRGAVVVAEDLTEVSF